ncbi:MAG: formylmethanofuran dehydrogenase [Bacteroidetes bacterium]|nr:MAG: formylmethanofuran dehydrogenase [Bacteroidota bacterium]
MMLEQLLQETARQHRHLCPRQVLGVRMGLMAGKTFQASFPQSDKRYVIICETDGCFTDGLSMVTNCTVGHRTLRIEDYGKIAATVIDTETERALRFSPGKSIRKLAQEYAPPGSTKWQGYLLGYQQMSEEELFVVQPVKLMTSIRSIVSMPGRKAMCVQCGEEIMNDRHIMNNGYSYCKPCFSGGYYEPIAIAGEALAPMQLSM